MQHRIYQTKVNDLDDLKRRLTDVWAGIQQSLIDDAINQWRTCPCACVRARGGHFEHSLQLSHYFVKLKFSPLSLRVNSTFASELANN